ncbi:hypothetical protein ACH5RR_017735 [Cinchona calisaya]|uniref:BHLH domain-containing protein n=1 Tax=Cinchona calisaya TaxID=153742 RepID=A0ABD2ZJK4_9GENT
MAEEFQGEVCGGNWWNSSRGMFGCSSPCLSSSGILDLGISFGWPNDFLDMKAIRSSDHDHQSGSANSDGSSIVIQDLQKTNQPADSASNNSNNNIPIDHSTLQILGIGLSSPTTTDWNQTNLMQDSIGRSEYQSNYQQFLQENHNSSMNYRQERGVEDDSSADQIEKEWTNSSLKNNFSTITKQNSSINSFKSSENNQPLNSITTSTSTGVSTTSFPISSVSYGYSSTFLQNLFDTDQLQPQQSLYENRLINYPSTTSYQTEFSPSLSKFSPLPKIQNTNNLQFSANNANFCNGSAAALNDIRAGFFPSLAEKPNLPNLTTKANSDEVQGLGLASKKINEPAFKRPRIETPSPLPTFKVRKEKLGDRITALQQLVSPFGKTDTASVLHEAIEYIKFLHDQVNMLSNPYLKNGSPIQRQQCLDKVKDQEGTKEDLKSRGLCLVPISSTFPVAAETTTDFWNPTFGGTFR